MVRDAPFTSAGSHDRYVGCFRELDKGLLRIGARYTASPRMYKGRIDELCYNLPRPPEGLPGSAQYGEIRAGFRVALTSSRSTPRLGRHLNENWVGGGPVRILPERLEHGIRHFPGPARLPMPLGHRVALCPDWSATSWTAPRFFTHRAPRHLARYEKHGRRS